MRQPVPTGTSGIGPKKIQSGNVTLFSENENPNAGKKT